VSDAKPSKPEWTVLTSASRPPPPRVRSGWLLRSKWLGVRVEALFPTRHAFGGPNSVRRSLLDGLARSGIAFNHNPEGSEDVGAVVCVPGGPEELARAIGWKRTGLCQTLLAGPNVVDTPDMYDRILEAPEIDACLVASGWVRDYFAGIAPRLAGKLHVWPAGVDMDYWAPCASPGAQRDVLLYCKNVEPQVLTGVEERLRRRAWRPQRIVYGRFHQAEFRSRLEASRFVVYFTRRETQGIASAEAWSMDRPTLVWASNEPVLDWRGPTTTASCPYLTDATGASWKTLAEFDSLLSGIEERLPGFSPRRWVQANLSDQVTTAKLLELARRLRRGTGERVALREAR
jgi:hypothetical protein